MKFMIRRYRLREEPLVSTLSSLTSYSLGFLILVIVK